MMPPVHGTGGFFMVSRSYISEMNFLKNSWKTREEVNSTIQQYNKKIAQLKKQKSKSTDIKSLSNEIKYYQHMLYLINLEYYQIIGNLK